MAVDWEYERRRKSKLHRLRRYAALAQPDADVADLKVMPGRSVDTELIARLAVGSYLAKQFGHAGQAHRLEPGECFNVDHAWPPP